MLQLTSRSHSPSPDRRASTVAAATAAGRRWRVYASVLAVATASLLALAVVPDLPLREGYLGLLLGAVGVLVVCAVVPPTGAPAPAEERWSFAALRKVKGWYVTDEVPFQHEDIPHVVVSPSAVLAVETRYRPRAVPGGRVETERHARDLAAAQRAAHKVRLLMRADHPLAAAPVVPVLVVWGPGAPVIRKGHRIEDGVQVVDGSYPERWLYLYNAPRIDADDRRELHAHFQGFLAAHAPRPVVAEPLRREVWRAFRAAVSAERGQREALRRQARSLKSPASVFHPVPVSAATTVPAVAVAALRTTEAGG